MPRCGQHNGEPMSLLFSTILHEAGISLANVRLLRHKDNRSAKGRSPYELWRDNRQQFELYQSTQKIENREKLKSRYWASFIGTPADETLFVGIYGVKGRKVLMKETPMPHRDDVDKAGTCDLYDLTLEQSLDAFIGRLLIDWGPGKRSWIQRADRKGKKITELRKEFKEPDFPGFLNFIQPLSKLKMLPRGWVDALGASRGVYLLTCPKTKEQYIGSATGENGFWRRWQDYIETGHGGNVGLKGRDPSDYQVSILEVAGTALTTADIIQMELRWKSKLQSREMGLNRN